MSVREEVRVFVSMGPLPDEASATEEQVNKLGEAIDKITPPVSREEAELLMTSFGAPDTCFGLAWAILHLIETAPGGPMLDAEPPDDANYWIKYMWIRIENGRRWGKTK